jgi:hypothetical protein
MVSFTLAIALSGRAVSKNLGTASCVSRLISRNRAVRPTCSTTVSG